MSINKSGTFIYSPDIVVGVMTNKGFIDVSSDVIDFTLDRQVNSIASFKCTLANPGRKYNRRINTMDRITVFMKRTKFVQVFSGYVTYAPIETFVPTPVTINAQCTIRILKTTYWDDTLIQFQQLLLNFMDSAMTSSSQTLNDGGVSQVIAQVLNRVCGWNPSAIHIQTVPQPFIDFAAQVYSNNIANGKDLDQNVVTQIANLIGSKGIVSGNNTGAVNYTPGNSYQTKNKTSPQPKLTTFNVSKVKSFHTHPIAGGVINSPGDNPDNPVSIGLINENIYWCSVPFPYFYGLGIGTPTEVTEAKSWIASNTAKSTNDGQLLVLTNTVHNRVVVVRATSIPQKANVTEHGKAVGDRSADYLQCHPGVVAYLNGSITGDPTSWREGAQDGGQALIKAEWAKENNISVGPQPQIEAAIATAKKNTSSALGQNSNNSQDSLVLTNAANELITKMRSVIGATYPVNDAKQSYYPSNWRENPTYVNPKNNAVGLFDCSGLIQWAYNTLFGSSLSHPVGGDTWAQFGAGNNSDAATHGLFIDKNTQPQVGDILFFSVPGDSGNPPQHVITLSSAIGQPNPYQNASAKPGVGWTIAANQTGIALNETPFVWSNNIGGKKNDWGAYYMGARRPLSMLKGWGANISQNFSTANTSASNPNDPGQRATISLTNAWNNVFNPPQYDVRATVLQGTPRAFLLDNPVMSDLEQIISAGMRCYQSAPNGDFVSWFPDYYGIYGTDPVLEISDVEIIDFQIYHNDDALATHIGIIGDTNGIGQNVSFADYFSTNGIVSIQDGSTMQMLFGKFNNQTNIDTQNSLSAINFLQKYGLRPYVQEQNMIHSHSLEYMMGLWTFMNQWVQQFASEVSLSFLPELYPGMRVVINIDNETGGTDQYQFYCTSVTHQGSRSTGFQTQAVFTAPIKNGAIMHYGLDLV